MDAFQWQYDPADKADDEHQAQLLRYMMNRFESQIDEVWSRLHFTQGLRLADLAVENDLEDMWQWWVFLNSSAGHAELGITSGKFSLHGMQARMDEDHEPTRMIEVHAFYNRPGQSSIPISNRSVEEHFDLALWQHFWSRLSANVPPKIPAIPPAGCAIENGDS